MKIEGYSAKEIMNTLNIRNRLQVKNWWKWYQNGEHYRFHQQVGKQYSYGKRLEELSEIEQLKIENKRKNAELEIQDGCILHSDQESFYTSYEYYKLCEEKSITRSMSRKGTPADNAPIECFHSSLKCETFYLNKELKSSNNIVIDIVENYIENYNKVRIQQKLGYLSPIEFRKLAS